MNGSYRMPAEWETQSAMWLSWPHNQETWPENLLEAQAEFIELVRVIAQFQPVKILCDGVAYRQASLGLDGYPNVELIAIPTNDAWARDYAPTFVKERGSGGLTAINWYYNAWGGKYPPFEDDQQVATRVAEHLGVPLVSPDLCFEGGGIEVNQSGLMLCTRSCAFDPNRNPGKSRESIEAIFRELLGVKQIVWLNGDAIEGDDTDGHIDQLARFVNDQTIVYAWCDDPLDPQREGLQKNLDDLHLGLAEAQQQDMRLIPLPIPPRRELYGRDIPASYCNFLIGNGWVVVPQFDSAGHDQQALECLTSLFPGRTVIGLNSLNLTVGLGSFHCLSQQQPA